MKKYWRVLTTICFENETNETKDRLRTITHMTLLILCPESRMIPSFTRIVDGQV